MKNRETSDGNGTSWNASDGENAYYARVLAEVERLQPVGAGDGILVLNLMYPCFETGARIGMGLFGAFRQRRVSRGIVEGRPTVYESAYPLSGTYGWP